MFKFENDITLLFISCISFHRGKVRAMGQCIKFSLLAPMVMCDDKIKIETRTMPIEFGIDSKHELLWNIASSYGMNA